MPRALSRPLPQLRCSGLSPRVHGRGLAHPRVGRAEARGRQGQSWAPARGPGHSAPRTLRETAPGDGVPGKRWLTPRGAHAALRPSKGRRAGWTPLRAPNTVFSPVSFRKQFQLRMTSGLNQDLRRRAASFSSITQVDCFLCLLAKTRFGPFNKAAGPSGLASPVSPSPGGSRWGSGTAGPCSVAGSSWGSLGCCLRPRVPDQHFSFTR